MKTNTAAPNSNTKFELALSAEALADIIANKTRPLEFNPTEAYDALSDANKQALVHLVKAAAILDKVFLKQDNANNLRAKAFLEQQAATGNVEAAQTLTLFTIFNGLEGTDLYAEESQPLPLFKNQKKPLGGGLYPADTTVEEMAAYIAEHPEQAAAILSYNTIVQREGSRFTALPYSIAFRDEMEGAARELLAAARATDHEDLASYLRWQAQALVNDSDPEALFNADKKWIYLEDCPLEFTISREVYDDVMTGALMNNPRVKAIVDEHKINVKQKDLIGVRVGIVNNESFQKIAIYRDHLPTLEALMPLREQYLLSADELTQQKFSLVDVDLVSFRGQCADLRSGIAIAQNLPNSDKLASHLNVGSRLVFHRQVRGTKASAEDKKFLDALVAPEQHSLYCSDASFYELVGHELAHSLGPKTTSDGRDRTAALGNLGSILEENKADLASVVMMDHLTARGIFEPEMAHKTNLTWMADLLPRKKPALDEAHRMRAIMQLNYFREKGAIHFEAGEKLRIVPEKMAPTARAMLTNVIQIQLDGDAEKANAFVQKYSTWNDAMAYAVAQYKTLNERRYRLIQPTLQNKLLAMSPL